MMGTFVFDSPIYSSACANSVDSACSTFVRFKVMINFLLTSLICLCDAAWQDREWGKYMKGVGGGGGGGGQLW